MLNMKSLTVLLVFILNLAITNGQIEDESDSNKAALGVPYAVGNPITVSNVCSFPENWHRIAGFRALTARLGIAIQSDSYKELLNYPGTFQLTTQQSSTTKPNFQISGLVGTLYGLTIIPSYLLIELTGYFVPPTSGEYTFSLEGSDDAAIIFIANPSTFKCGHVDDWPTAYDNDVTVTDSIHTTRTIYMIEGVAYPIRIAYYNGLSLGKLQASFTDPEGVKRVDWNGYIWRYDACDTCSYVPPPTVVTTESSSWVLNPTTTGTSYSTALGIDGLPTTYTIYQVVVPTITESLAIPPPITQTDTHPDYLEEEVVSYYSTTNAEGSPITGTTTSTIRTILIIPPPITITVTKEGWEEEQEISYFSTTDANGNGITGTITKTLRLRVDVPTPYTTTYTSNHEQIEAEVSYIPTVDEDGKPTYFTTTKVIAISHLPPPPGYTVTIDVGNEVTHYEVVSYFTTEDENGKFYTGTSTVTFTPPSPTTITVTKEGVEETDYISFFITTDAEHNIITGSSVSKILDDGLDKTTVVTDEDGTVHTDIISHITTTDAEGNPTIILTTYPSPTDDGLDQTTVVTDEDGTVHTDIISHITTTDAEGNPTIILTTYPSPTDDGLDKTTVVTDEDGTVHTDIISHITTTDAEGNPTIILTTYPSPTDDGLDKTTVVTDEDGTVHTDIISHITTTDAEGNPTIILTTDPSPTDDGLDKTTVVTDEDGTVHTDIISHITTTDAEGNPTIILTTYPSPTDDGLDKTTVVTDEDGTVHTDIISHITTTDAEGKPTTILTTYPSPTDSIGNPIALSNVCSFPESRSRTAGFRVLTAGLGIWITSDSYKELLNYSGSSQLITQQSSTTQPNFEIGGLVGNIYGLTVVPSYLLVELTGYFVPPVSGEYSFSLEGSDDAAIIFIGNPSTFKCGNIEDWPTPNEADISVTDTIHASRTIYMVEGVAYPIRIAYYNGLSTGRLQASFTDPRGIRRVDWNGYIWRYDACDTCSYVPPPTVVTTESSSWVLNPTTTGTSYSTALGIDGLPTTYTIYQVVVPTITESLAIPPPITQTDTHPDYLEEEVVSYYSTTNAEGSPITGTTTSTIRTILIIPPPITITVTKEGWEEEQEISYFSTTDANGNGITGSTTRTITFHVNLPTPFTTTFTSNHEQIEGEVSYIPTVDEDGKPTYFTTTKVIAISHLPPPPGYTVTIDVGNEVTHYEVVSYFTTEDENGKFYTGTSTVTFTPPSPTTITVTKEGVEETDYISFFITTDAEHNIITGSSVSKILDDGLDKTTVVTDEDGTVHTDIISHITTTDAEGKPTTILTTYPSPTDSIGNPIALSNVCSFPESRSRTAGFRVLTAGLGIWITSDSYKELLNYSGSSQLITQQSSTTQPNFEIGGLVGNIYGLTVVPSYLLVELTGYFVPPVSGEYSFSLEGSDDAAIIFIGNPSTFKCGNIEDWPTPNEADISVTDTIHASRTIYMVEGVAYPIRIAYYNGLSTGRLQASFTDPRGIRRVDWNGYIWRYDACDTCSYVPPPTVVTTESSSWVLNPTTTGTSYSTALGIDGLPTTYTIYQVVVPTITESLAIPPPITQTDTHPDYLEEEVVSYYSTTNAEGSPITGTTTSTIRTILIIPPPITITVTKEGWEEEQEISYFSTTDANGNGITGSTTRTITFHVNLPTPFTTTFTSNHEQIEGEVSYIPTVDEDGKPTYFTTTKVIAISHLPPPPGYTVTIDVGNEVTHYEVVSYFTTEDENGKFYTGTSTVTFTPPSPTTITVTKEGVEETDYISFFITTDAEHNIITGSSVSKILDDGLDKTTVVTDEDGTVHTDIISHITTTDAEGNPTIILTTYPSPTDDGLDKTTVVTDEDGTVHTDIISHITTTDAEGNPTIILTTYPSPTDDGLDKTTVVTDEDGTVHTDIISHITTTDAEGNPTIILTTYLSPLEDGKDRPTVVSNSDSTLPPHKLPSSSRGNSDIEPSPTSNSISLPEISRSVGNNLQPSSSATIAAVISEDNSSSPVIMESDSFGTSDQSRLEGQSIGTDDFVYIETVDITVLETSLPTNETTSRHTSIIEGSVKGAAPSVKNNFTITVLPLIVVLALCVV
ncbi:hypothetical protein J7298_02978 [Nakaseomyces glabratus]|nr:hypothetical protein J7298_02978 [Nakaseomyces glabratus]